MRKRRTESVVVHVLIRHHSRVTGDVSADHLLNLAPRELAHRNRPDAPITLLYPEHWRLCFPRRLYPLAHRWVLPYAMDSMPARPTADVRLVCFDDPL